MRKYLGLATGVLATLAVSGCNREPLEASRQMCDCRQGSQAGQASAPTPAAGGAGESQSAEAENSGGSGRSATRQRHHRHETSWGGYGSFSEADQDERSAWHRTAHGGGWQRHGSVRYSYSSQEMSSYSYHSPSHLYREDGDDTSGYPDSAESGYASGGTDATEADGGWRDGYGRYHNRARLSRATVRSRLDPWHGYDKDCDGRTR